MGCSIGSYFLKKKITSENLVLFSLLFTLTPYSGRSKLNPENAESSAFNRNRSKEEYLLLKIWTTRAEKSLLFWCDCIGKYRCLDSLFH